MHHVAAVHDGKVFSSYVVNGAVQDGEAEVELSPQGCRAIVEIGVRINMVYYFKGADSLRRVSRGAH